MVLIAEVARLTNKLEVKNREFVRKNGLADLGQLASHVTHEVPISLVPVTLTVTFFRWRLADDTASLNI